MMDRLIREHSLQEALRAVDSDDEDRNHLPLDMRNLSSFVSAKAKTPRETVRGAGMRSDTKSKGSSSDDKLSVQCGISEKESK